jgi:very-short-patch-repair endonuclease
MKNTKNKIIRYNPYLRTLARKLRKESTLSEILLWQQIKSKSLGVEFHRQVPIDNYIVDFYCHELNLVIEIDGSSHHDEEVEKNDFSRQERLEGLGIKFIRFDDLEIKKNMQHVLASLEIRIKQLG